MSKKETKVIPNEYKGASLFSVFEMDEDEQPEKYPVVSFGLKKAKAVLKHLDELKEYIKENE